MGSVKIVQSGDFHLDSPLTSHKGNFREQRREELLQSVGRLVAHAVSEKADLLLLAGDIFDSARVRKSTFDYLSRVFSQFPGPIFISPGNHDPYEPQSPYAMAELPGNVKVFSDYEEVFLPELGAAVCGAGFRNSNVNRSLLAGIRAPLFDGIRILVMHGEVSGSENPYNPIRPGEIAESGFDYVALGHRHDFSGILREGRTFYGYAGIPEGRGFDEAGARGCITGTISRSGVDLKFRELPGRQYLVEEVDITGASSSTEVCDIISGKGAHDPHSIVRFILKGEVPGHSTIDASIIRSFLARKLFDCEIIDRSTPAFESGEGKGLLGIFSARMEKLISEGREDREILDEAMRLGTRALCKRDI